MALIKCPECGNEISDKAEKCPHCGNTVNKKTDILPKDIIECPECHKVLHSSTKICPYCGYSIKQGKKLNENIISQLKEKIPQIKKIYDKCKKEKRISIGIAAGIVAVAIFILIMLGNGKLGSQNYQKSVQSVSYEILSGASDAEDCGNLIKKQLYDQKKCGIILSMKKVILKQIDLRNRMDISLMILMTHLIIYLRTILLEKK